MQSAKEVLDHNWTGSFTKPADKLYPHQWSWDSAFIAIGATHYDQGRAEQELRHLFAGQWDNGMVPHIVFNQKNNRRSYFPGPDFWQSYRSEYAPRKIETSGICQPPVHAPAILHILNYAKNQDRARSFASEIFPKLEAWHNFLSRERDPDGEGLVYIRHPWESGQDNSPAFDPVLKRLELTEKEIPEYERKDVRYDKAGDRPTDANYDRYVYLVDYFRKRDYDEARIRSDGCPFLIQDVMFNVLFCRADRDLAAIAQVLDKDPSPYLERAEKAAKAINKKQWNEEDGLYLNVDLKNRRQIRSHELSGVMPLYAEIPAPDRIERLFDYLNSADFCRLHRDCLAVPSYDRRESEYSPTNYWRGPIWINLNWMLREGLLKNGHDKYARKIKNTIIELVKTKGFYEYYDPDTGDGYGADNFSWSAALFLDVCYRE